MTAPSQRTPPSVVAQVASLPTLPMPEIKALWQRLFGTDAPTHNRQFLERRLAYRLQEDAFRKVDPGLLERNRRREEGGQEERVPAMSDVLKRRLRCAVYTRKSTDEGLDQEYNSIDAQRDTGHAYIASQRAEGWIPVADDYDDPAYSGGNMDRPALKRLLADIEAGKVDVVVIDKIDRLTRSLAYFSKMVEVFERYGVSFVSITQQFNTTTSMGRLMLNILLSFA
jgi:predicted site-specific integrase-resolvase